MPIADTKSWVYDATEKEMKYTAYSAADDWLFTPPFEAKKGSHTLEFRARAEKYRYPESIEVTLGSDVLPGESQTVIASYPEINSTLSELYTVDFSVPVRRDLIYRFTCYYPRSVGIVI